MRGRRGGTLIEILIACGLFLLALIVIGQLTVRAMTSHTQTVDKNQVFRAATIVLDQLQRDLEHAEAIYCPDKDPFGIYHPGHPDPALVLRTRGSNSPVVGYRYDAQAHVLLRLLYDPAFDPAVPASQVLLGGGASKRVSAIEDFQVNFLQRSQSWGTLMVETRVAVATGTGPNLILGSKTRLRKI